MWVKALPGYGDRQFEGVDSLRFAVTKFSVD